MKPVQSTLKTWLKTNKSFQENYTKLREEVLKDPEIKAFLAENPQLSKQMIERNLMKLYEYKSQSKQCKDCSCFKDCINTLPGYSPILSLRNESEVHLTYEKCHNRINHESQSKQEQLIQSLYMPRDILGATVEAIDQSEGKRKEAILALSHFLNQLSEGLPPKGIYFHGPFGVGKTYFLGAVANYLKRYKFSSMIIYMPEFVREMKNSISDGSLNIKVEQFKQTDVLMLDDIGAETQSAWFRDEILGSILQYRMMEGLPVFFTSNFNLTELKEQLAETRGKIEDVKAHRIIERIKQVSVEATVSGSNRRS